MVMRWVAAIVLSAACAMPRAADPVADFYRDKQVNLIVGYGSRRRLRHLRAAARPPSRQVHSRQSDGHRAEHAGRRQPARGQLSLQRRAQTTAPRSACSRATCRFSASSAAIPRFSSIRASSPGSALSSSFVNDAYILIVRKDAPVKSIEEARRQDLPPLVLGGTAEGGIGSRRADHPARHHRPARQAGRRLSRHRAIFLAIERGEVHGRTVDLSSVKSVKPEWLKPNSNYRVLVQFARATRHPDFPDVPMARELAKNEAARALIELAEMPYAFSRPFAAPPQVPADRAQGAARGIPRRSPRSAISGRRRQGSRST